MGNNPHIFLTRANQHIQEINRHFDGTLNHYGPVLFSENQEQEEPYTFKEMLLQPDNSDFILHFHTGNVYCGAVPNFHVSILLTKKQIISVQKQHPQLGFTFITSLGVVLIMVQFH